MCSEQHPVRKSLSHMTTVSCSITQSPKAHIRPGSECMASGDRAEAEICAKGRGSEDLLPVQQAGPAAWQRGSLF